MHELSLTLSILEIIDQYAESHQFAKVNAITLSLGRLSCVMPKAIEFAFNVQARGSRAEGARLIFEVLPAVVHCYHCGEDSEVDVFEAICPRCQAVEVQLTRGTEELRLMEFDVD